MKEAVIFILQFVLFQQQPLPSLLQLAGNLPILRVDELVLALGPSGLVPGLFHALLP